MAGCLPWLPAVRTTPRAALTCRRRTSMGEGRASPGSRRHLARRRRWAGTPCRSRRSARARPYGPAAGTGGALLRLGRHLLPRPGELVLRLLERDRHVRVLQLLDGPCGPVPGVLACGRMPLSGSGPGNRCLPRRGGLLRWYPVAGEGPGRRVQPVRLPSPRRALPCSAGRLPRPGQHAGASSPPRRGAPPRRPRPGRPR